MGYVGNGLAEPHRGQWVELCHCSTNDPFHVTDFIVRWLFQSELADSVLGHSNLQMDQCQWPKLGRDQMLGKS